MTMIMVRRMFTHIMLIWRSAFLPQCGTISPSANGHLNLVTERGPYGRPN
jgi:hypothetical protein